MEQTKKIIILALVLIISLLFFYTTVKLNVSGGGENPGKLVSIFSALNMAFATIALIILIILVTGQNDKLKYLINELALMGNETKNQNDNMIRQIFENTFFNLIENNKNFVQNLKFTEGDTELQGDPVFDALYKKLQDANNQAFENSQQKDMKLISPSDVFEIFLEGKGQVLKPWFSNIISILKFIEDKCTWSREQYIESLESQVLKNQKIFLIYYLAWKSDPASTHLVKQAKIFKDSDLQNVVQPEHSQKIESIFGRHAMARDENLVSERTIQLESVPSAETDDSSLT